MINSVNKVGTLQGVSSSRQDLNKAVNQGNDQEQLSLKGHQEAIKERPVDIQDVEKEMNKMNKMLEAADIKDITFKIHEESEQIYALVIDTKTKEVIKTFPPEYLLDLSAKMKDLVGIFLDQKI